MSGVFCSGGELFRHNPPSVAATRSKDGSDELSERATLLLKDSSIDSPAQSEAADDVNDDNSSDGCEEGIVEVIIKA